MLLEGIGEINRRWVGPGMTSTPQVNRVWGMWDLLIVLGNSIFNLHNGDSKGVWKYW